MRPSDVDDEILRHETCHTAIVQLQKKQKRVYLFFSIERSLKSLFFQLHM